jgi:hypothetical protein
MMNMWLLLLATQMIPPVEAAKGGGGWLRGGPFSPNGANAGGGGIERTVGRVGGCRRNGWGTHDRRCGRRWDQ